MASFGAQPNGKRHFCTLLRYSSLMCIQHTAFEMSCSATKMAVSLRSELVLTGPNNRIAVVVSTYNKPEYLRLVLAGYGQQTDKNFALYIADDGSDKKTRDFVETLSSHFPVPVRHVWHEDAGFRKCRIHNRALAGTEESYVILTDGDCVPLPGMVAAHRSHAAKDSFISGSRILLSRRWTQELCEMQSVPAGHWLRHRLRGDINRLWPVLAPVHLGRPYTRLKGIRGCHLSCWRKDVEHVNGFDETFEGWGREDSDLVARLLHSGLQRRDLRGMPVLHLWHGDEPRHRLEMNDKLLKACMDAQRIRALKGLDEISGVKHGQ